MPSNSYIDPNIDMLELYLEIAFPAEVFLPFVVDINSITNPFIAFIDTIKSFL